MKKMLLAVLVLVMAQISLAAGLSREKLAERVNPIAEKIEAAKLKNAGDFTKDATVMKLVDRSLEKIVSAAQSGNKEALIKLINTNAGREVLMEIGRLSSIIGDKDATEADKSSAKKALTLLSLSANSIELLVKNEAEAKEQQVKVELAIKVSERIAKFNSFTSETAKTYAKAYETALTNRMSPREAMKEAGRVAKKEIKEEDILNCLI